VEQTEKTPLGGVLGLNQVEELPQCIHSRRPPANISGFLRPRTQVGGDTFNLPVLPILSSLFHRLIFEEIQDAQALMAILNSRCSRSLGHLEPSKRVSA